METVELSTEDINSNKLSIFKSDIQKEKPKKKRLSPRKKFILLTASIVIIIAGITVATYLYVMKGNTKAASNITVSSYVPTPTPTPTPVFNPINGEIVSAEEQANLNRPPLAVMIENSTDARPQSGLNSADVVYEALAEGGITRFMAVFLQNTPLRIGPVRSVRTYYLDWASEYNPIFSHWGGNSDALAEIPTIGIHNVDAMYMSGSDNTCASDTSNQKTIFCRDPSRYAPHNGYGDTQLIWNYGANQKWSSSSTFTQWTFKDDAPLAQRGVDGIHLNISFMSNDTDYAVNWAYNQTNNNYTRYNYSNVVQLDRADNTPITAKTIIVQYVTAENYTSSSGKVVFRFDNTGSGNASIFEDGKEIDGTWKKASMDGRTLYYDTNGNLISLNRGKIWITFLQPDLGNFTYK